MDMEKIERMEEECMSEAEWMDENNKIVVSQERINDIVVLQIVSLILLLFIFFI